MPSPFPGMDPYLEDTKVWPAFQHQLVAGLYHILLPGLVDRYRARISVRSYTVELALFTSIVRESHDEQYLEIRDRNDGRLVTLMDVASPANKTTATGRAAYLGTRQQAEAVRASAVEIDLVSQGQPLLDFNRDGLPEHDYTVTATRGTSPGRYEIYAASVAKRLPKFKLPVAPDDRDVSLDLQDVFRRAYDVGGFAKLIDYRSPLPADNQISESTRAWIEATLTQQKLR